MYRRSFITATGLTALTALAGCLSDKSPPPRKSNVIERIEATTNTIRIDLADQGWVKSRYDSTGKLRDPPDLDALAPVGVAEAKGGIFGSGGGRGATGRAAGGHASAPKTSHGWAWWHGGVYANDWYDDHDDEIEQYDVHLREVGVRYFGSNDEYEDDRPGAGPVAWDRVYDSPDDVVKHPFELTGWYRVGVHIAGTTVNQDFGWECFDFEVVPDHPGYEIANKWKISPRI